MKVLIVVDMQNDFIDGSLGTKEAVGIVDRVAEVMGWIWVENPAARRARSVSTSQLVPGYFNKSA